MNESDRAYSDLNNAIWAQAVNDDMKIQKRRLFHQIAMCIFKRVLERDKYKTIDEVIINNEPQLLNAVRYKVAREAIEWPQNNKKDYQFEKDFADIRDGVLQKLFKILNLRKGIKMNCKECYHWTGKICRAFNVVYEKDCPAYINKKNKTAINRLNRALQDYYETKKKKVD